MQLPAMHSSSEHVGLLFLLVQDAKFLNRIAGRYSGGSQCRFRLTALVIHLERDMYGCTVLLKIVVRAVMILHGIQITCGSLKVVSRIDLEGTLSIAQYKSKLWRTKKR